MFCLERVVIKMAKKTKGVKKMGLLLGVVLMLSIVSGASYYLYGLNSNQTIEIDTIGNYIFINGNNIPVDIEETLYLKYNTTNVSSYVVENYADVGFSLNVTHTLTDLEGLTIGGLGVYYIPAAATVFINVSYHVDLWGNLSTLNGVLRFELM